MCSTVSSKIQSDEFSIETFIRVESILSDPHPGAFCQIMDIIMSGLTTMDISNCVELKVALDFTFPIEHH